MLIFQKSRKNIFITFVIIIAIGLLAWAVFKKESVKAYEVKTQDAVKGIIVTGIVKSRHDIMLAPSSTGRIKEIRFKEGDLVTKGQILAVLDYREALGNLISAQGQFESSKAHVRNLQTEPPPQQVVIDKAGITQAQNNIESLNQDLINSQIQLKDNLSDESRTLKLYEQGAVSFRDYEKASFARTETQTRVARLQNQIQAAKAGLVQAREKLSLTVTGTKPEAIDVAQGQVKSSKGSIESAAGRIGNYVVEAPITGYITSKILDKGEVASPTSPILRLVSPEFIYVNAEIEENQLKDIKIGQIANIIFDAYPDEIIQGRVIEILRNINPNTGTFEAKISIFNPKKKPVIVGMTSDVEIINLKIKKAVVIPQEFVNTENRKQFVYKKMGAKAIKTSIAGEKFDNNRFKVNTGLKSGDVIVKSETARLLKPDSRIKIREYYKD